ncbi:epithelial sodium channel subunit beta-like isoform X2 [Tachypleus tridentatus]
MYPKKCEAIRENREKGFINITELATLTYWSYSLNISERASLGHQEWPLITLCRGQYMDNCSDLVFFYQYLFSNCYTIEQPLKLDNWKNVWITQVVTMILNFETEDFMEVLRQPGGFLFIHPLDSLPDFRRDYVEVNPGSKVDIKLQKRSTILRDSPITKCTDYTSVLSHWYPNKKMNPRQCSQECLAEAVEQQCGCAHFTSIYPNVRRCNEVNATEYGCIFEAEKIHVDNCLDSCAPPCEKEYYEQQMSYFQWPTRLEELRRLLPNDLKNMTLEFAQKQLAEVTVSFPSNEHIIHKHQPKFEAVEVFSYVGGYIGIWLGVSLVTLWEFLERLILLLQFILQNLCCKLAGCSQVKPKHKSTVIQMTTH